MQRRLTATPIANSLGTGYCVAGMVKGEGMERYVDRLAI